MGNAVATYLRGKRNKRTGHTVLEHNMIEFHRGRLSEDGTVIPEENSARGKLL